MDMLRYIEKRFEKEGMIIPESQAVQFEKYFKILIETNKVMNLTAITEFKAVVEKHFLDSALLSKYIDFREVKSMIDVGTGAGFPGIPLKILYPQLKVTLLDSLNKRIQFLQNVVDKLGLSDVELIHGRAEDFGRNPAYREQYDLCVSRAVANLSTLSEYCTPFIRCGGTFAAYKSGVIDEELEHAKGAIRLLGCRTRRVEKFSLKPETEDCGTENSEQQIGKEGEEQGRSFVIIERLEHIGKKYPRKAGMPSKMPLSVSNQFNKK